MRKNRKGRAEHMKKSVKNALLTTGVFLAAGAATVAGTYFTTKVLVKIALDRKEPDIVKKAGDAIAGKAADAAFMEEIETAAEKLEKEPHELEQIICRTLVPRKKCKAYCYCHARMAFDMGKRFRNGCRLLGKE